ncbi:MAG TPA: YkgJ family cysteine cluster protein [Desulfurivibrio alkaliphilus]|uniref:YkgJ family cysteine cluster protein n=1 Tax=Desulfurivibrio alkaliphilus TaxID=427923 RepID=A0A7C2THD8_9BACT|nr:YkgJ family cysteine cluster protein [Desulfurivibrio alkaliphilus]
MSIKPPEEQVQPLQGEEQFAFDCGPDLSCFTECCRALDLVLTPYDVLRLRQNLGITSDQFLERYAMVEASEDEAFPMVFLAMVDDGRASCPFVAVSGCTVYQDRPAACRAYPLGRGLRLTGCDGRKIQELFVLVREPHCRGFELDRKKDAATWMDGQGLAAYNRVSDALLPLLRHPKIQQGWRPTPAQKAQYLKTLYQLEHLQEQLLAGEADRLVAADPQGRAATELAALDEMELLLVAIDWLRNEFKL